MNFNKRVEFFVQKLAFITDVIISIVNTVTYSGR